MSIRQLDVSWRKAAPIPIIFLPDGPREVESMLGPNPRDERDTRRGARFQVNTNGILWFGDVFICLHGDERVGRVIPWSKENEREADFAERTNLLHAPVLLDGAMWVERAGWIVVMLEDCRRVFNGRGADLFPILQQIGAWRRVTRGIPVSFRELA